MNAKLFQILFWSIIAAAVFCFVQELILLGIGLILLSMVILYYARSRATRLSPSEIERLEAHEPISTQKCSKCGQTAEGRVYTFHYGKYVNDIISRTHHSDPIQIDKKQTLTMSYCMVGSEEVFFCHRCAAVEDRRGLIRIWAIALVVFVLAFVLPLVFYKTESTIVQCGSDLCYNDSGMADSGIVTILMIGGAAAFLAALYFTPGIIVSWVNYFRARSNPQVFQRMSLVRDHTALPVREREKTMQAQGYEVYILSTYFETLHPN